MNLIKSFLCFYLLWFIAFWLVEGRSTNLCMMAGAIAILLSNFIDRIAGWRNHD